MDIVEYLIHISINVFVHRDFMEMNVNTVRFVVGINEIFVLFKGCPSGYYGQNCDYQCQGDDPYCKGLLICLPDPYGCSCYSGWYGTNCNLSKTLFFSLIRNIF